MGIGVFRQAPRFLSRDPPRGSPAEDLILKGFRLPAQGCPQPWDCEKRAANPEWVASCLGWLDPSPFRIGTEPFQGSPECAACPGLGQPWAERQNPFGMASSSHSVNSSQEISTSAVTRTTPKTRNQKRKCQVPAREQESCRCERGSIGATELGGDPLSLAFLRSAAPAVELSGLALGASN